MRKVIGFLAVALLSAAPSFAATLPPAPAAAGVSESGMLHVERFGSGTPVVLLPGLASGAWTWNGVIPHLAASHTVYAVSFAGFAGTPPANGEVSIARFADDLDAFMQKNHLDKVALVGHSLGGTLAIAYAESRPQRVSNVVAVDGLPVFPTMAQAASGQRVAAAAMMANAVRTQTAEQFGSFEQQYFSTIGVSDSALAKQLAQLSSQSDRPTVARWLQEDLGSDLRPQLGAIRAPLTEIMGWSSGEPYTQEQKAAFYRAILADAPGAHVVTIPNARHFVMLDQPQAFADALDAALAR